MTKFKDIIKSKESEWASDNFEGWKVTEIMYCKLEWVIHSLDGSEELEDHINTLLSIQNFIEDLQKIE